MKKRLQIYREVLIICRREQINRYLSEQVEKQFQPVVVGQPKVKKLGVMSQHKGGLSR